MIGIVQICKFQIRLVNISQQHYHILNPKKTATAVFVKRYESIFVESTVNFVINNDRGLFTNKI